MLLHLSLLSEQTKDYFSRRGLFVMRSIVFPEWPTLCLDRLTGLPPFRTLASGFVRAVLGVFTLV